MYFLVLIASWIITWVVVTVACRRNRTHCGAIRQINLYNNDLYKITHPDGHTEIIKLDFNPSEDFQVGDKFKRINGFEGNKK